MPESPLKIMPATPESHLDAGRLGMEPSRPVARTARALRIKTFVVLALAVIAGALGNLFLSRGMKLVGDFGSTPGEWLAAFVRAFSIAQVRLGIACLIGFFLLYLATLSWADLSFVMPSSAVGYIVVALLAYFVVGERITVLRWTGTVAISLGVLLVGGTPPRTTPLVADLSCGVDCEER